MLQTIIKILLFFFVAKECQSQLMCYVCDDCPKVTDKTPLLACNENSFNEKVLTMSTTMKTTSSNPTIDDKDSTTMAATTTTTTTTSKETTTPTATTTTTTTPMTLSSTEEMITTEPPPMSNDTTTESIPQPPTVGPLISTTMIPTPPTEGTLMPSLNESTIEDKPFNKSYMPSSTFRGQRQRRHIVSDPVTYHCFTIEKKYPGKNRIQRGCSFVHTNEAVCTQLKAANNYTVAKCEPCSKSQCNGSSTISVSFGAFIIGAVLFLFKH